MVLKPQDVFILLKLIARDRNDWSYQSLASELFMSVSEVHAGIKRATAAKLMDDYRKMPVKKALEEFLIHGVRYAFPPTRGELTRGVPTGYAAPPLSGHFQKSEEPPPVWPDPEGETRGFEFSPLYKSAPKAAAIDNGLYELLTLVDAIRDGGARERRMAMTELQKRIAPKC